MPSDWIETFLDLTDTLRSPRSFRLWTAIATIAGILERKVWTETDVDRLYPNLYTILAGNPASGKTIMVSFARSVLVDLCTPGGLFLGPDNPNKSTFLDNLENAAKKSINGQGTPIYSAMMVLCAEFGVLISKFEKDFVADLTTLYDNPPFYSSPRRVSKSVNLEAPTVNILAAATPDALGDIIPESAWGQGFTSRIVFIYGTAPDLRRNIFDKRKNVDISVLKEKAKEFYNEIHGEMEWEDPAREAMETWFNIEKMAPVPTYGRLVNYAGRRDTHVMKLAMISAVSSGHGLTVTLSDFLRAKAWLLEAEETMPDVFRAMAQKSDQQLLTDAHYHLYTKWSRVDRKERKSIKEREIWQFFEDKVPNERIDSLIIALQRTGRIRPSLIAGEWIPNTLDKVQEL